jgi:CBS domain-containing protein
MALLERAVPFDRLRPEERRQLLCEVLVEYFEPDEVILEQGRTTHEFLYIVESGFVRLLDPQTQRLVGECGEGRVFGGHGVVEGGALPYEARTVEPTVCVLLRAGRFRELYLAHKAFAAFFDSDLSRYRTRQLPLDASSARLLFGTRLGDLVHRQPVVCDPGATAREAATTMRRESVDSAVVVCDRRVVGILTDMELRDGLVAEAAPVETPVGRLMSERVVRLQADAPVFEALMAMMRERAYHVVITDGLGPEAPLLGVVSDKDVSRAQGYSPAFVLERTEEADSVAELVRIRGETTGLILSLERRGVRPRDLIAINTEVNDRLMVRALGLVEAELAENSPGLRVDLPWAWLSLGSEGRGEMGLLTDQDNALVYADPSNPEEAEKAERWFRELAEKANLVLSECGFALCEGDVMARNPKWRGPLSSWNETFRRWILEPEARTLIEAAVFFDLRCLYGEPALVEELKASIEQALRQESRFLPLLARNALADHSSPFFLRSMVERIGGYSDALNIKRRGITPLVNIARLFAMQLRYLDSANTFDRFRHAAKALPEMSKTVEQASDAYNQLVELRFDHHLQEIERGENLSNRIDPYALSSTRQEMLRVALSAVGGVRDAVAHRYGAL